MWIMRYETEKVNNFALNLLDLKANQHVLEIGFGHGITLEKIAQMDESIKLAGVDHSQLAVESFQKKSRNHSMISVECASGSQLPFNDNSFDRIFGVHIHYFLKNFRQFLLEVHRALNNDGKFILVGKYGQKSLGNFPADVYQFYPKEEIKKQLELVGFKQVEIKKDNMLGSELFGIIGIK